MRVVRGSDGGGGRGGLVPACALVQRSVLSLLFFYRASLSPAMVSESSHALFCWLPLCRCSPQVIRRIVEELRAWRRELDAEAAAEWWRRRSGQRLHRKAGHVGGSGSGAGGGEGGGGGSGGSGGGGGGRLQRSAEAQRADEALVAELPWRLPMLLGQMASQEVREHSFSCTRTSRLGRAYGPVFPSRSPCFSTLPGLPAAADSAP